VILRTGPGEPDLRAFPPSAGFAFRSTSLLEQALTHSSFVNEYPELGLVDNQRLEFLGDAIVDFLVAEWLYLRYPDAREGELTALRAHVVRTEGLSMFAREIKLGSFLRLGRGEATSGGHDRPANLCAGFEALVGAAYLDQGLGATREWVHSLLVRHATEIDARRAAKDAKSLLQERTQAGLHVTPVYQIVREAGPDHAKVFTAQVLVDGAVWGEGTGLSKQSAEQAAAEAALEAHYPSPDDPSP
jgi:ribonuclease-3